MRILVLSDDFPPQNAGGAGAVAFKLAKAVNMAGHEVFVITTTREKQDEGTAGYEGLKIFKIYADYHMRWRAYLGLYNPQTIGRVKKIIHDVRPDVVHAHNIHGYLSYHCLKTAKNFNAAVFLTAHDTMLFSYGKFVPRTPDSYKLSAWDLMGQAQKRYNPLRNIIIRHYLRCVDKIFAVSAGLEKALRENMIDNAELLYNGVDVKDWELDFSKIEAFKEKYNLRNKKIIFFGGRLSYQKGGEYAMRALGEIRRQVPNAVLLVAGGKHIFGRQMEESASSRSGAIFTGWLQGDELKAAYLAADIVIAPSIYFDCIPIIMIEAMACKKPVVASYLANASEVILDNATGYVADPHNQTEFSGKIIDLLNNQAKARQFGLAGYARVQELFNLKDQVSQTLSWYQRYLK